MKRWRYLGGCIWIVENDFSQWTDYGGQRLAQYLLGKFKNKVTSWIHMGWTEWDFAWVKGYLPPVEGLDCHWFSDECELWHVVFEWWVLVLQAVQFARLYFANTRYIVRDLLLLYGITALIHWCESHVLTNALQWWIWRETDSSVSTAECG